MTAPPPEPGPASRMFGKLIACGLVAWFAWIKIGEMAAGSRRFLAWAAGAAALAWLIARRAGLSRRLLAFGRDRRSGEPLGALGLWLLWSLGACFVWMGEFGVSLAREMSPRWPAGWLGLMAVVAGGAWLVGANAWRRWVLVAMGAALGGVLRWGLGPEAYDALAMVLIALAWALAMAFSEPDVQF